MPLQFETGILTGIRQDYLLFLGLIGGVHLVLIAFATTISGWGDKVGRRLFLALGLAGVCGTSLLLLDLVTFLWMTENLFTIVIRDTLRFGIAASFLGAGCALSPRFTWGCALGGMVAIGVLMGVLGGMLGERGIAIGVGVGIAASAIGLIVHILRFHGPDKLDPNARIPICLVVGAFLLVAGEAIFRKGASWAVIDPALILPAVMPWASAMAIWVFNDGVKNIARLRETGDPPMPFSLWFFPAIQVVILFLGWVGTEVLSRPAMAHALEHLHLQISASTSAVNPNLFDAMVEHDPTPGHADRMQQALDSIREDTPGAEDAILWEFKGNARIISAISHDPEQSLFELSVVPTASELKSILGTKPVAVPLTLPDRGFRFLASAPIFSEYPDQVVGWLSLVMEPRGFVSMIAKSRTGSMVIVGLLSLLGTGLFVLYVRGQIEQDLRIGMERAEVADRAKSEFLAIMSHEIRTPLQSVLGYTDLVVDTPLDESQRHHVELIRSQGLTLMRIVQDILDFSAMRRGSFSLQLKTVLLRDLMEDVAATASPMADRKGLRFEFTVSDDLPAQVRADNVRLRQVLHNLLGNAIKYTSRGQVSFDVRPDPLESLSIEAGEQTTVVFRVTDTGHGIPTSARERLFEPFFRSENGLVEDEGGAGLGLAIVQRLCELMGATIDVESTIGHGTTIEVRAPFVVASAEPTGVESILPALDEDDGGTPPVLAWELPMSILLVEDNTFIQGLFLEYLMKLGYQADVVDNGRDAVSACLQTQYDLILMDLKLPVLSGPDAVREIRQMGREEEDPWIIGLSASTRDEDINEALNAGMNDFLAKPVNLRGLLETILFSPLGKSLAGVAEDIIESPAVAEKGEDWTTVAGGPSRVRAYGLFAQETPGIMEEMRAAYEEADLLKVRNRAHYLKNSGIYLKDTALVELCEIICTDATEARHQEVGLELNRLEDLVVAIMTSEAMTGQA